MTAAVDELLELQRRFGGPGWLRRLEVDVFVDERVAPGSFVFLAELGRLLVHSVADFKLLLALTELPRTVRQIFDDELLRFARRFGIAYERDMLRAADAAGVPR